MPLNGATVPVATAVDLARAAALRTLSRPMVTSVLVDVTDKADDVAEWRVGFSQLVSGWWGGGEKLKSCWIEMLRDGTKAKLISSGTFGREQFAQLASVDPGGFPPPALPIDQLAIEPKALLDILRNKRIDGMPGAGLALSLCMFESTLAWRSIQERGLGATTLILSARDGTILYERSSAGRH